MKAHGSLYETITNDIIAELEKGVAPWVKPWTAEGGGMPLLPYNATSQRRYQGVNVLILWRTTMRKGYRSPAWLSYRQALGLGGHVKKGEKATALVYASTFVPRDERDKAEAEQKLEQLKPEVENPILVSAKTQFNLDLLRQEILRKLEGYIKASFWVPMTSATMSLISWVHEGADVKKIDYADNSVQVVLEADPEFAEKLKKRVEDLNGKFEVCIKSR